MLFQYRLYIGSTVSFFMEKGILLNKGINITLLSSYSYVQGNCRNDTFS